MNNIERNHLVNILRATDSSGDAVAQVIEALDKHDVKNIMFENNCDAFLLVHPSYGGLNGFIFHDSKKRFDDGTSVRVSTVQDVRAANEFFTVVTTRNTTYLCIG